MERNLILIVCLPLISLFSIVTQNDFPAGRNTHLNPSGNQTLPTGEPLCTDCHAGLVGKTVLHAPAKEGCGSCHHVNVADHPEKVAKGLFLADTMPGLCYACHDGVKKDVDTNRVVHKAVSEKKLCLNCHSPHSSDEKKLLTGNKKELCLSCHDKDVDANGRKTKNIRQLLAASKVIHPAINGGCVSCHKPHASAENYLLISPFPVELYVPGKKENYGVCWECHDSDLLELAETATATNFRNGEKNLHNIHLRGARGRSCVLCHDVHASNNKFLILDKIAFGKWSFTLNFAPADSGGSCSPGCHGYAVYKR
jgi:predicted CXXCH cytochrome family protein